MAQIAHYWDRIRNAPPLPSHLFTTIRRQIEDQHSEEADAHAGDDEVNCVEQSLPPHGDVEGDVQVGLVTAGVELDISERCSL